MDEIITQNGRRVVAQQLSSPNDLVVAFDGENYVVLLWATDNSIGDTARMQIMITLIQSGCRYIVCGGVDCERWHDAADFAWVESDIGSPGNTPHVMTTWHEGESPEEVASFATNCTFDEHESKCLVVLVVGSDPNRRNTIDGIFRRAVGS